MKQTFWEKYKVFILGLIGSIVVALQPFLNNTAFDLKVLGYAALMAVLSYVANQWRGQGISIIGIVGTLAYAFVTLQTSGTFTWQQFILSGVLAILSAVAPPPKQLAYEHSPTIVAAKAEGEEIKAGEIADATTGIKTVPK